MGRSAPKVAPEDEAIAGRAPGQDPAIEDPDAEDPVDTWGMASFPASDPPQWWAGPPD